MLSDVKKTIFCIMALYFTGLIWRGVRRRDVILKIARGLGLSAADLVSDGGDEANAIHWRALDLNAIGIADKSTLAPGRY